MNVPEQTKKRFWDKVDRSGHCWNWTAGKAGKGYGSFWLEGKNVRAHRFVYSLLYGNIPDGLFICHHCDNPLCVKPSHLFLGTNSDNIRDSVAKGGCRTPRNIGEKNANSKLCENDVREIRRLCSLGVRQNLLAKMWEISNAHISCIVHRKWWSHI